MLNRFLPKYFLSLAVSSLTLLTFTTTATAFSFNEANDGDLSDDRSSPTNLGILELGNNNLKATFNSSVPDYFTFTVPEEQVLTNIVLNSWNFDPSFEDIAFFAVQKGNQFDYTFDSSNPTASGLLGWSHLRSTQVGDPNKILLEMSLSNSNPTTNGIDDIYKDEANSNPYDNLGLSDLEVEALETRLETLSNTWISGATGFSLPLGAGDYAFWLRQGSETLITVDLDFQTADATVNPPATTPEPSFLIGLITTMGLGVIVGKKNN